MSDMALKAQETIVHIRKGLVSSIRVFYKLSCDHPIVWGFIFSLLILYRYHPSLFACLISSTPVVVCTAILLGTLLIYGDANISETEGEHNIQGSQNVGTGDNNALSDNESFSVDHVARKSAHSSEGKGLRTKPALSSHFGSLYSTWQPTDDHDAYSGSESDHAESSSSDASVCDTILPMLDELHPLLDSDAPQAELRSVDNSDIASGGSSEDQESDDLSAEEETENQEDEEDEAHEKDDATEVVLKWTADDQKNLMDLGTSELERNQRLESLIAKRRAKKFLSFHIEKNLIDLGGNDPVPSTDEVSCFNFQIPSISALRQNPFDIPFEEETTGLPPAPGSAPSVLQPRHNPFDVPFDQGEENGIHTQATMNQQEFASSPQRDMFFRRHENFAMGASSSGDTKQETHDPIFKPYFVAQRMISEGPGFVSFQRESIAKVDSKVSSDHESNTTSSDVDQKNHKELVEAEMYPESHLLPLASCFAEPVDGDSQSSKEVESVDVPHEQIGIDEGISMDLNASSVTEGTHQDDGAFAAVEMEIRPGEYSSPESDAGKIEVIEEKYDDSSSSSSEALENHSKKSYESSNSEQGRNNSVTNPDGSVRSFSTDADLSMTSDGMDDGHHVGPVYDSSPSAVENTLSISSALEDALFHAGKGEGSTSGNSVTSNVQIDSSEEGSARRPHNDDVSSEERLLESDNGGTWVAPPCLSLVEQYESRSREVTEIREQDVIQIGLSEISEEFVHPDSPVPPKFVLPSRLSLVGTDSGDYAVGGDAVINNGGSSNSTPKPLTPREVSSILHSDRAGRLIVNSVDLPSIPEEHSEYLRMEDEHENMIDQTATSSSLIGMDLVEDPMEGFAEDGHLDIDVGDKGSHVKQSDESSTGVELVRYSALKLGKIRKIAKLW